MFFFTSLRRKVLSVGALLIIAGCAGMTPYEPRDNREEGPEKGLFTGAEGEFVILRKAEESKKGSENEKNPDEPESVGQP